MVPGTSPWEGGSVSPQHGTGRRSGPYWFARELGGPGVAPLGSRSPRGQELPRILSM